MAQQQQHQGPEIQISASQGQTTFKSVVETKYNRPPFSQIPLFQDVLRLANGIEAAMTEALKGPVKEGGDDGLDAMLEAEDAGTSAPASVAMLGFSDGSVKPAPKKSRKVQPKAVATQRASAGTAPTPTAEAAEAAETMSQTGSSKSKTKAAAAHEAALDSMDTEMRQVALSHLNTGKGTSVKCLSLLQVKCFFEKSEKDAKNLVHCLASVPCLVVRKPSSESSMYVVHHYVIMSLLWPGRLGEVHLFSEQHLTGV